MSGGKNEKPQATPVSEGEKIQARLARDQIDYYKGTYQPLEQRFLSEAQQDYSPRLSAQAGSGAMRSATETLRQAAIGGGVTNTAALGAAIAEGRLAGAAQGRRERDDMRLDAINVGLGITADANRSLAQAGQLQTSSAIDRANEELVKMQAKQNTKNALVAAAGTLAGAGATYYGLNRLNQPKAMSMAEAAEAYRGTPRLTQTFQQRNALING